VVLVLIDRGILPEERADTLRVVAKDRWSSTLAPSSRGGFRLDSDCMIDPGPQILFTPKILGGLDRYVA